MPINEETVSCHDCISKEWIEILKNVIVTIISTRKHYIIHRTDFITISLQ